MIRDIFCGKTILFTVSSIPFLNEITTFLEIEYLRNEMVSLQDKLDEIEQMIRSSTEMKLRHFLKKVICSKIFFLIKNHYKTIFELIDPIYLYSILLSCSDTI